MKPTQAVIDLSKKLWEKGVRKKISEGDWYRHGGIDIVALCVTPILVKKYIKHDNAFPIWVSCDECIEWLREKSIATLVMEIREKQSCVSYVYPPHSSAPLAIAKAPTLIEALLKAMVVVAENKEKQ